MNQPRSFFYWLSFAIILCSCGKSNEKPNDQPYINFQVPYALVDTAGNYLTIARTNQLFGDYKNIYCTDSLGLSRLNKNVYQAGDRIEFVMEYNNQALPDLGSNDTNLRRVFIHYSGTDTDTISFRLKIGNPCLNLLKYNNDTIYYRCEYRVPGIKVVKP